MIIAPSVLSMDYSRMKEQTIGVMESGAQWLHFDVMDGHFVPNLTFGPDILKGFRKLTDLLLDVHVMIEDPDYFAERFIEAGAGCYTFHYEAVRDEEKIHALLGKIRALGCKAGLSIKPNTPVEALKPFLLEADLFLIMSVEPGFGGQKFMPDSLEKIRTLKRMLQEAGSSALIEVDGGINGETAALVRSAGVDVVVAGSYFFKNDFKKAVKTLEGE